MFFEMAFKNIWRNKRRTVLVELSIVFGIIVIVFTGALTYGMSRFWAINTTEKKVGAIQIEHIDYEKEYKFKPLETTLENSDELIQQIVRFPHITSAYGVLEISGFISNGSKSTTFFGNGLNAAAMKKTLPRLEKTVRKGRSLGENLKEIVLGVKLAEDLELEIGDPVMLLVQTLKGGLNMIDLVLVGTNEGGASDYASAHYVEIHLPTARKLMRMPNRVSRIVIAHNDFDEIRESAVLMQQSLDQTSSVPLRVKDYTETIPGYSINKFFSLISIVVGIVLFFVVGSGIANAMFMSVMERRKEIGTMKAVGAEQSHIRRLFILEGMIIAIVGAVIGLGLASIIVVLVREAGGVPFPPPPGSSIPITIPTIINPSATVFAVILAVVVGIAASYLPARISAKVDPVETLREV